MNSITTSELICIKDNLNLILNMFYVNLTTFLMMMTHLNISSLPIMTLLIY